MLGAVEFDPLADPTATRGPPPSVVAIASPPPPPPPALSLTSPPPPPAVQQIACAPGCEVHGTCNRELGRCDCPPLTAGEACEINLVPSCSRLWGLKLPAAPCQAFATEQTDYRDFPPSCECLAECQALNVRVVYVDNCVNASQMMLRTPPPPRAPPRWTCNVQRVQRALLRVSIPF